MGAQRPHQVRGRPLPLTDDLAALERAYLRALSYRFPSVSTALAEIAHLRAVLALPRGSIHVVSDVHGEFRKLEHVLRNASGSLRVLCDRVLPELGNEARARVQNFVYYPRETFARATAGLDHATARARVEETIAHLVTLLRALAGRYGQRHLGRVFPSAYAAVFQELLGGPALGRAPAYAAGLLAPYLDHDGGLELVRELAHTIRALSAYEVVVAGDLGDRGPRLDRVIEALRHQRNLSITWGNHDAEWMGACLGQEALVATVLRNSLRYGRTAQLEEGYGIPLEPLEQLAQAAYADDPATRFVPKGVDDRSPLLLARMQKAAAILQFKLEGETLRRNPHFGMTHRDLLSQVDPAAGTVTVDGVVHPLLDRHFPTVDFRDPLRLSPDEARCLARLRAAFLDSPSLWRDMSFVESRGAMSLVRDEQVVFHACVPCDEHGEWLDVAIDGVPVRGRALFQACDQVVRRAFRSRAEADVDFFYFLWAAPRSPLFGKDRMATFEGYFVEDPRTHVETKNPYFHFLHDPAFCRRLGVELGAEGGEDVLVVNGHVPVKLEKGESPLKRSKLAVTIDGAFSEAYGDHGYTLVVDAERTYLARHHHFTSVDEAIARGDDIVPTIEELRVHPRPRAVDDTAKGAELRAEIEGLERLVAAYRAHTLEPPTT